MSMHVCACLSVNVCVLEGKEIDSEEAQNKEVVFCVCVNVFVLMLLCMCMFETERRCVCVWWGVWGGCRSTQYVCECERERR